MPVYKLRANSLPDAMKSDEGNDSLDNFIRQAIGKEPYLSFSRTGDSPVQWIQLLHALDQQELPGWPLLTPVKVQMQKCEKCSREFCSSINYRRHIRVHRRSLNPDKDSSVNRDLLGAFWDKLSYDEAKETISLQNVTLEEVPGSSIVKALTSFIRKPGFSSLPHVYVKAGSAILDIVQCRASRFPISSQDLFSILDDASERTFLCGTAVSLQKYIFDGEAAKIGLEMKNLVACTSFLVEQKLVKAWVADKDAEALRCQKLLVEEEEAAQERKAELLERKRQKKLRQKEQKVKELANAEKADSKERLTDLSGEPAIETSSSPVTSNSHSPGSPDSVRSFLESIQQLNDKDADVVVQPEIGSSFPNLGTSVNGEQQTMQEIGRQRFVSARWQVPKFQRVALNGFHGTPNTELSKHGAVQRHGANREPRGAVVVNGNKVWTRKPKPDYDGVSSQNRIQIEAANQQSKSKSYEVLIGSIPVELRNSSSHQQERGPDGIQDGCVSDHQLLEKNIIEEKACKPDPAQCSMNRSVTKLWREVSRQEARCSGAEEDVFTVKANASSPSSESCLTSCAMDESSNGSENNSVSPSEESENSGGLWFSSRAAEAFLTQRWKEAIAADHVQVVASPESEPPWIQNDGRAAATPSSPKRCILGRAENRLANGTAFESATDRTTKSKSRTNPEKGIKVIKYIPKQRNSE